MTLVGHLRNESNIISFSNNSPDQVSTGKLVADIASKFKEHDIDIQILASTPQYRFDSKKFTEEGLNKISKNIYTSIYKNVNNSSICL